ncbi:MAG: glycosyltransferase family 10 [Planctomycetaceae bacterium]
MTVPELPQNRTPIIACLRYGALKKHFTRLSEVEFSQVDWPLGAPAIGRRLADLSANDHVLLPASSRAATVSRAGLSCGVSLMLAEPECIKPNFYRLLPAFAPRFDHVLTHSTRVLTGLRNALFLAHGDSLDLPSHDMPRTEKNGRISIIASGKAYTVGQRLRHQIVEWAKSHVSDLSVFGRQYHPIDDKSQGLSPFMFSVAIENSQSPGYFTEKLIDCLLCHTIPVYWGAPDICHFFDPRGLVICRTEKELRDAVVSVDEAEYRSREPWLEMNRQRALTYLNYPKRAAEIIAGLQMSGGAVSAAETRNAA